MTHEPATPAGGDGSPWDVPPPILFNAWKHHAGALRQQIADVRASGVEALVVLPGQLLVMGTELMDLYTGALLPRQIGAAVVAALSGERRLAWEEYHKWVEAGGGYRVLVLTADDSSWVLRLGEAGGRYVHLHPGRRTSHTLRVRANVLRTAVLVLAHVAVHGGDPLEVTLINQVRQRFLGLAPIKELEGDRGLRGMIELLGGPAPKPEQSG
jgi:hypothetical protein